MSQMVRIALDAMGGDHGPAVVVAGAELALARRPESTFLFFGNMAQVAPLVARHPALQSASRVVHAEIRRAHGGQAEPGASPRPAQILDVAGHRRG